MSMMGSAGAASASAAFMRGASSNAAEAAMNWRRDKVNRGGAGIVRDLRTKVFGGFAEDSNMKCGPESSGTGVPPVCRFTIRTGGTPVPLRWKRRGRRSFLCLSTHRTCEWLNTDREPSADETPAAPWILRRRTLLLLSWIGGFAASFRQ